MTTAPEPVDEPISPEDLEARTRASTALRRLGHSIVSHDVEPAALHDLADEVERRLAVVEAGEPRHRSIESMKQHMFLEPGEGQRIGTFPDCVVSGEANPMGIGAQFFRRGNEAVAHIRLGPAFEGAPNRAHGGVIAAIFDDLMGFVLHVIATPAFTAELTVRYLAPAPLAVETEWRGWLRDRDDRKLYIEAEAAHGDKVFASASALFIAIDRQRLRGA
jgi:acyl-coenzyme A thioesterase PaaI-like protein